MFRFKNLYQQFDIFFLTVQKFANFLEGKHADLTKFDLVIIDGKFLNTAGKIKSICLIQECHHCYDNHPINSMMRQYHRLKASGYAVPQIVAL